MAGAALLDLDDRGRRGVDLPRVASTYWPHRANFDRIRRTALDWRVLCPGPMVDQPPLGLERIRISLDRVPVQVPSLISALPGALLLPFFLARIEPGAGTEVVASWSPLEAKTLGAPMIGR
jgi:hypothetical protein